MPANQFLMRYLLCPQKDIFNATILKREDVYVPTMLNFSELVNAETGETLYNFTDQLHHMSQAEAANSFALSTGAAGNIHGDDNVSLYEDAFKAVSDFKNFKYNPVYIFIQSLIEENINSVFSPNRNLEFNNFGFDIGSVGHVDDQNAFGALTGGFDIFDSFTTKLVNIDSTLEGNKELELLSNAYNVEKTADMTNTLTPGKLLYSYLFKDGSAVFSRHDDSSFMFHLIMNYFHKYNISFNSMFNQLCFPSMLFNAAGLRLSVSRINEVIEQIEKRDYASFGNKETYKHRMFEFIIYYLSRYTDKVGNNTVVAFDIAKNFRYQVGYNKRTTRDPVDTFETIRDRIDQLVTTRGINPTELLANQYIGPTVANNFMSEILEYITVGKRNEKEHCEKLQTLFGSGIMEAIRHIDSLTTYVNVLIMLLKETSYYSHEYDRDMSYFNIEDPNAFSVV